MVTDDTPDDPPEVELHTTTELWKGKFGEDYRKRSPGDVQSNTQFFSRALGKAEQPIEWVIEFGAGVGNNLRAINRLSPRTLTTAVEINENAAALITATECVIGSIFDYPTAERAPHDVAFTKGLLIHIPPQHLRQAYEVIYNASRRYVLLAEYYSPKERMIPYRGHDNVLWARDFAGEMLDMFPDLKLIDYGFTYHRDEYPQDDISWFLMEKKSA